MAAARPGSRKCSTTRARECRCARLRQQLELYSVAAPSSALPRPRNARFSDGLLIEDQKSDGIEPVSQRTKTPRFDVRQVVEVAFDREVDIERAAPGQTVDQVERIPPFQHQLLHQDIVGKHRDDGGAADVDDAHAGSVPQARPFERACRPGIGLALSWSNISHPRTSSREPVRQRCASLPVPGSCARVLAGR